MAKSFHLSITPNVFINKYPTIYLHLFVYADQFIEQNIFHAIPVWRLRQLSLHLEQYLKAALLRRSTQQAVAADLVLWYSRRTARPAGTKQSLSFTPRHHWSTESTAWTLIQEKLPRRFHT